MHRVELKGFSTSAQAASPLVFLMHRVELKERRLKRFQVSHICSEPTEWDGDLLIGLKGVVLLLEVLSPLSGMVT